MLTLFLDFCSHRKCFALTEDASVLAEMELQDHTDESSVMPAIETLLKNADRTLKDIGRIAAVTGPGGFMSQRVGLSIANALSWSLHIPISGLHLSDLYAARVHEDALWIHSTKKQLLFIRGLGAYAQSWPEPVTITLSDLKNITEGFYVGEVLSEQAAVLSMQPLSEMKEITDVLPHLTNSLQYGPKSLLPWYGRGA